MKKLVNQTKKGYNILNDDINMERSMFMAKTICVYNQKGGVGKSTCACNLSYALGIMGRKVLLIDFDAQGSATIMLNINKWDETIPNIGFPMSNFAINGNRPQIDDLLDCIQTPSWQKKEKVPNSMLWREVDVPYPFDVIPVCGIELSVAENAIFNRKNYIYKHVEYGFVMLKFIVQKLSDELNYDYIIIDANPSLSASAINALMASDFLVTPTDMAYESIVGISAILQRLKELNLFLPYFTPLGVICQKYKGNRNLDKTVRDIIEENEFDVFNTTIPDVASQVSNSIAKGKLISVDNEKVRKAYTDLATEIEAKIIKLESEHGEIKNRIRED